MPETSNFIKGKIFRRILVKNDANCRKRYAERDEFNEK